jgi:hypothetical protein
MASALALQHEPPPVAAKALVQPLSIRLPLNQVKRPELYCGLFCWPDCRRHRCCAPGFVEPGDWISCHGRVLEPYRGQHAEAAVRRCRLWKISRYSKIALASSTRVR